MKRWLLMIALAALAAGCNHYPNEKGLELEKQIQALNQEVAALSDTVGMLDVWADSMSVWSADVYDKLMRLYDLKQAPPPEIKDIRNKLFEICEWIKGAGAVECQKNYLSGPGDTQDPKPKPNYPPD